MNKISTFTQARNNASRYKVKRYIPNVATFMLCICVNYVCGFMHSSNHIYHLDIFNVFQTGEMEVKNPLFQDDPTPAQTPATKTGNGGENQKK